MGSLTITIYMFTMATVLLAGIIFGNTEPISGGILTVFLFILGLSYGKLSDKVWLRRHGIIIDDNKKA